MNNGVAKALHTIGILAIILGVIGSFFLGKSFALGREEFNFAVFLAGAIYSGISGMLLYGFGEAVAILDDSKQYLRHIAEKLDETPKTTNTSPVKKKNDDDELPFI